MLPLLVFAAGGAGTLARWGVGLAWLRVVGPERPWLATLLINIVGSFLMGLLTAFLVARGGEATARLRPILATGILGGFTTFSAFSLDAGLMIERKDYLTAGGYLGGSVLFGVLGLFAGLMLGRRVFA